LLYWACLAWPRALCISPALRLRPGSTIQNATSPRSSRRSIFRGLSSAYTYSFSLASQYNAASPHLNEISAVMLAFSHTSSLLLSVPRTLFCMGSSRQARKLNSPQGLSLALYASVSQPSNYSHPFQRCSQSSLLLDRNAILIGWPHHSLNLILALCSTRGWLSALVCPINDLKFSRFAAVNGRRHLEDKSLNLCFPSTSSSSPNVSRMKGSTDLDPS